GGEHREFQCRRRDRPGAGALRHPDCARLLAHAPKLHSLRLRGERGRDGMRIPAGGLSALRLRAGGAMSDTVVRESTGDAQQKIAVAAGIALLVAGLLLVTVVLPAEFAVDPLGVGAKLGLMELGAVGRQVEALNAS